MADHEQGVKDEVAAAFQHKQRQEASLADGYFEQALDALRNAASADSLWRRELPPRYGQDSILGPIQQRMTAVNERLTSLRASVLFSALAVEATANQFLSIVLSPADVRTIDRLPTLDKLIVGPRLAGADTPFVRGSEPIQTLKRLFDARNALVHPKPGRAATHAHVVMTEHDLATYGPKTTVEYLVAGAHAGVLLGDLLTYKLTFAATASNIWTWRAVLDEHLRRFPDDIRALPAPDESPVRELLVQMEARAVHQAERDPRSVEQRLNESRAERITRQRGPLKPYKPPER